MHSAGLGQKVVSRVLGADANFNRVAAGDYFCLFKRQWLACGNSQLPFDKVFAGDHLGDRVLHLKTRVHFHEKKLTVFADDELDRACTAIGNRARRGNGRFAHFFAHIVSN